MNELSIDYSLKGFLKYLAITVSGYSTIFGIYLCITQVLIPNYNYLFYCSLVLTVLSVVLLLSVTLWSDKPLLVINFEYITANIPGQSKTEIEWAKVTELGLGVSYLSFKTIDSKQHEIDLSTLRYNDLKNIKSKLIELCETKSIPFRNN